MTAQVPDVLIYRGRRLDLCSTPLDTCVRRLPKARRPKFVRPSTALHRGYVATWEIVDRRLYLVDLDGHIDTGDAIERADLAAIFPGRPRPVPATWVSEFLYCPEGRLRCYVHAGFGSLYEREREFSVVRGEVKDEFLVYNPPMPLVYAIDPDGKRTFLAGATRFRGDAAPDPFPDNAPVEPWRLWGRPDWDMNETEGYLVGGALFFGEPPAET